MEAIFYENNPALNFTNDEIEKGKASAAFVYAFFFIPFFSGIFMKNRFVLYHANQSFLIFMVNTFLFSAGTLVYMLNLGVYDVYISGILYISAFILSVIFIITGIVHSFNGEARQLPLIGNIGAKFRPIK